jgi:hypothetical protein
MEPEDLNPQKSLCEKFKFHIKFNFRYLIHAKMEPRLSLVFIFKRQNGYVHMYRIMFLLYVFVVFLFNYLEDNSKNYKTNIIL